MLFQLHCPPLDDLVEAFNSHFAKCFSKVSCRIIDCPDLTQPNIGLTMKGLCGSETLCDVGSFDYLLPVPNKNKRYDLLVTASQANVKSGSIIGAAAGPHFVSGVASELVVNMSCADGKVSNNASYCGSYDAEHHAPVSTLSDSPSFAMLGQMYLCEGQQGPVIELTCSGRTREGKFDGFLREALTAKYGNSELPVGVGGVIIQESGKCMFHVLPEFSSSCLDTPDKVKQWLKFFEMDAPVISVGTAVSHDPDQQLKLRLEHFHCFNVDRTKAGHCHFDTDGASASYRAYLIPGRQLLRYDHP